MIRAGNIIKHPEFMDVAFNVHKVRGPYGPNQKYELSGEWINQGFVKSFPLGVRQKLTLTFEQLKVWQICLEPLSECLRYERWK